MPQLLLPAENLFLLHLVTRCAAVVGCIGAFCVVFFYLFDPRPHSALSRPLLFAALGDGFSAASKLFGVLPTTNASGQINLACQAQAVLLQTMDLFSLFWSVFIAASLYHIVCKSSHDRSAPASVRRWDRVWALASLLLALAISLPWAWVGEDLARPMSRGPVYAATVTWCWVSDAYPWVQILVLYVPVTVVFVSISVIFGMVGVKIWRTEKRLRLSQQRVEQAMAAACALPSPPPGLSPGMALGGTRPSLSRVCQPEFGAKQTRITAVFFRDRNPSAVTVNSPITPRLPSQRRQKRRRNLASYATGVLAYLIVFLLTWLPGFVGRIHFLITLREEYAILLMRAMTAPTRGVFGLFIYLYLVRKTGKVAKKRRRKAERTPRRQASVASLHEQVKGYVPARKDSAQWLADMAMRPPASSLQDIADEVEEEEPTPDSSSDEDLAESAASPVTDCLATPQTPFSWLRRASAQQPPL